MQPLKVFLHLVGAFYMLAGFVLARTVITSRLFDQAIAAITFEDTSKADRLKERYAIVLSLVVFASGLALICIARPAVYLFIVGTVLQAAWIFWFAPRFVDEPGEEKDAGRRQATNALVIYAAMTALVAWADQTGRLSSWADLTDAWKLAAGVAFVAFAVHMAWMYVRMTLHKPKRSDAWTDLPPDDDRQPPS